MENEFERLISTYRKRFEQTSLEIETDAHARAHVALILSPDRDGQLETLFIKRTQRVDDPWSGHMAFPGGGAESLESPLVTAIRETEEEIGLKLDESYYLGRASRHYARGAHIRGESLLVSAEVFYQRNPLSNKQFDLCPDEVSQTYLFSLSELLHPKHSGMMDFKRGNLTVNLPFVELKQQKIWGLTYLLLTDFFRQCEGLPLGLKDDQMIDLSSWR